MKLRIAILIFGLIIISMGDVYGADWKFFGFSGNSLFYYDGQSMTRPSKNVVRVWVKKDFTEKGVIDMVEELGKKYENLSHGIHLWEINCVEKMNRVLSGTQYNNKGGVIYSSSSLTEWKFIIPDSIAEALYEEVCK